MDTAVLVDNRIHDGRMLIAELDRSGFDVTAAFWVKTAEDGLWFLYIGSSRLEPGKLGDAYRAVYACLQRLPEAGITISDVKLVSATDPIVRDALAVRKRRPDRTPIRWGGSQLGDLSVEEAYIYPDVGLMTVDEVLHTVAGLMRRTGMIPPSAVTFADGHTIQAIPLGVTMPRPGGTIRVVLHDVTTGRNEEIDAEQIAKIL